MCCFVGPESTPSLICGFNLRPLHLVDNRKVEGRKRNSNASLDTSFSMARKYAY
jgi:hypothetical protein